MEKEKKEEKEELKEVVKEVVKEERKSHVWLITVLVICLMAVCGLFGWLAGASYFAFHKEETTEKGTKKEDKKEDKAVEPEKLTEADVNSYMMNLNGFIAYFGTKIPMETASISNQDLLFYASRNITREGSSFTKAQVDSAIQGLFGADRQYTIEDINCLVSGHGALYKYDPATETYDFDPNHPGHGGGGSIRALIKYVDAEKLNDTLTIKTKILYEENCGDTCGPSLSFYSSASSKEPIYTGDKTECYQNGNCPKVEEVYPQVQEQLPITTFTFTKQSDGSFGLSKVTVE